MSRTVRDYPVTSRRRVGKDERRRHVLTVRHAQQLVRRATGQRPESEKVAQKLVRASKILTDQERWWDMALKRQMNRRQAKLVKQRREPKPVEEQETSSEQVAAPQVIQQPKIAIVVGICPTGRIVGNCLTCDGCGSGMRGQISDMSGISQSDRVHGELVTLGLVPLAISANGHPCAFGHPSEQRC